MSMVEKENGHWRTAALSEIAESIEYGYTELATHDPTDEEIGMRRERTGLTGNWKWMREPRVCAQGTR